MKVYIVIIYGFLWSFLAVGQYNLFELSINNEPLIKVLQQVETDYGFLFSYQPKELKKHQIKAQIKATTIHELMDALLQTSNLEYEIINKNYIVIRKKAPAKTTLICGKVIDEKDKQALAYANVIIEGTTLGTSTKADGTFELNYAVKANDNVRISYVGYDSKLVNIAEFKNENCPTIPLSYPEIADAFLVITDYLTGGISLEHNGASTEIKPNLMGNLAGSIEPDVLAAIQFLPGISSPSSRVSDIYIRGGTPDQNLMIWEDIPIYHSAHYFGMISTFNPHIIESAKIYRGGFDATYGGRIAGVIDLQSGDENSYQNKIGLAANMTYAQAYLHQKLKSERPTSVTFSARRSYNEIVETPTFTGYSTTNQQGLVLGQHEIGLDSIDIENDFYFFDTQLKISSKINAKNRIELAGIYAVNDFNDELYDKRRNKQILEQIDSFYLNNAGLSASWQHQWNSNWETTLKAIAVNYQFKYNYQYKEMKKGNSREKEISDFGLRHNSIKDMQFSVNNSYTASKGQQWQMGYHLTCYQINYNFIDYLKRRNSNDEISDTSTANLHALYAHYQNPIENKIGLQAGVRLNYFSNTRKVYVEPRIRLDYRLSNSISLHSNYGLHHQVIGQVLEFDGNQNGFSTPIWELAKKDEGIKVQQAQIYQVGLIYKANGWVVDVQAFGRKVKGLSSRAYDFEMLNNTDMMMNNRAKVIIGDAKIHGIDLLIKKQIGPLRTWISYALSKNNLNFKARAFKDFPSNYDQRHSFNWTKQLRLNNWQIASSLKIASGLPYTEIEAVDEVRNMQGNPGSSPPPEQPNDYKIIYGTTNQHNLPFTKTVNLSANYQLQPNTFSSKPFKAFIGLSILNVFNQQNINSRYYTLIGTDDDIKIKQVDKSNLGFLPNFSFRVEW